MKRLEGVHWHKFGCELNWAVVKTNPTKTHVVNTLNSLVGPALGFATSKRDRRLLKFLLTKLTSATYLSLFTKIYKKRFEKK